MGKYTKLNFLRELLPRRCERGRHRTPFWPFRWWARHGSDIVLDCLYGVDTGPGVSAEKRGGNGGNHCSYAYDPAPWWTLSRSLRLAQLRAENFNFVDIGCGKGRVLLSALAFPFTRVVGVELSPELHKIAEQNIASARFITRRCSSVQMICGDAAAFMIPEGPNIIFFYNPFPLDIMESVLDNVLQRYSGVSRPVYLIFYGCSAIIGGINGFLALNTNGHARRLVSTTVGHRTVNIFELP